MKTFLTTVAAALTLAAPAWAAGSAAALDADANGVLSIEEIRAAFPDVSDAAFQEMDVNADGSLDADEVTAAQDSGLMPPIDG